MLGVAFACMICVCLFIALGWCLFGLVGMCGLVCYDLELVICYFTFEFGGSLVVYVCFVCS